MVRSDWQIEEEIEDCKEELRRNRYDGDKNTRRNLDKKLKVLEKELRKLRKASRKDGEYSTRERKDK